jgi:hypothetical protein
MAPTARISVIFHGGDFYVKPVDKIQICLKLGKNFGHTKRKP